MQKKDAKEKKRKKIHEAKKDVKEKKTRKKKRWPECFFFLIFFIIMAYWINLGSRGREVITAGLKNTEGPISRIFDMKCPDSIKVNGNDIGPLLAIVKFKIGIVISFYL